VRPTRALIDLDAFTHNITVAKAFAGDADVIAVLKADAYGHGLERMCVAAVGTNLVTKIALTSVEEAMRVRSAGVRCPVVLLEGCFEQIELQWCLENNIELVFHSAYQFDYLVAAFAGADSDDFASCRLWLKLNTGMNRLGFSLPEAAERLQWIRSMPRLELVGTLMHFASADEVGSESAAMQLKNYQQFLLAMPGCGQQSAANSAALSANKSALYDAVRPGVMLYGASPLAYKKAADLGLKPVMKLLSHVIAVREIEVGETVGYGATWRAEKPTRMGVVAIGYADGYPRHASSLAFVAIRGQRVPVIGRVSMDMITVDLSGLSEVFVGDEVELWGDAIPVEEVAACCGTISYELLTGITSRVPRFYVRDGAIVE
jgi:alanine racemase